MTDPRGKPTVLFLCIHNAGRSQMALGFFKHLAGDRAVAFSGGSEPADQINAVAVSAMAEKGIAISGQQPQRWTDEMVQAADVVVTMGCGDACPFIAGRRYEDWNVPDPLRQPIEAVRPIRDEIELRVRRLLHELRVAPSQRSQSYFNRWLENAERRQVSSDVVVEIARRHAITPRSFEILDTVDEIKDPGGKSFFLIPPTTRGHDARKVTLMTYILNAGTDYGTAAKRPADFSETPYSAAEVARIINRQDANRWSYARDVRFVHRNGGRLATTPNGMLMGLGGNWIQRQFSQRGGTTWGDIWMVNMGYRIDPAEQLRRIVRSGHAWFADKSGKPAESNLDLDRVLHHEERHCRQWAAKSYPGMLRDYSWELFRELVFRKANRLEEDAGLSDGGYRA